MNGDRRPGQTGGAPRSLPLPAAPRRLIVRGMKRPRSAAIAAVGLGVVAFAAWAQPGGARQDGPNPGIVSAALPPGYLPRASLPDSLALLPPPPAEGSAAYARDEEARQSVAALRGSARWARAASDAVLSFPQVAETFSCAAGLPIGREATPRLYGLLGKIKI